MAISPGHGIGVIISSSLMDLSNLPHNLMHVYSKVSPTVCNGTYSQERVYRTEGPILFNFLVPVQKQCSPEEREQMFPDLEKASMTVLLLQDAVHASLVRLQQYWKIGVGPYSFIPENPDDVHPKLFYFHISPLSHVVMRKNTFPKKAPPPHN